MSLKIGNKNSLEIMRFLDFGAYLQELEGDEEVLLPRRYITDDMEVGDVVDVFVYNDSENRPVATTEEPKAQVGDFAFLQVKNVNETGAFLDWGLVCKDLLVPFREQKVRMTEGRYYVVYVYLDDATKRIVASAKIDKFLDNKIPQYVPNQKVNIMVTQRTELGFKVIVDDLFSGLIYHNQIYGDVNIGERLTAYVRTVRNDGKIDLILGKGEVQRVDDLSDRIYEYLEANGGKMSLGDKSSPEEIKAKFQCSKKDFKKALGSLFKAKKILILPDGVSLVK